MEKQLFELFSKSLNRIADLYHDKGHENLEPEWIENFTTDELNKLSKDCHFYCNFEDENEEYDFASKPPSISLLLYFFALKIQFDAPLSENEIKLLNKILNDCEWKLIRKQL